jgi:hypothetical protein
MLSLLTDEHISPVVAVQTRRKYPGISITAMEDWRSGQFMGAPDAIFIPAAAGDGLTVLSYDLRSIPPLLKMWAAHGIDHLGIIFVDGKTIPSHDFGGLVRAIGQLWEDERDADWRNRVMFLPPAR